MNAFRMLNHLGKLKNNTFPSKCTARTINNREMVKSNINRFLADDLSPQTHNLSSKQ